MTDSTLCEDYGHKFETITASVRGHGTLITGVTQECRWCGGLKFEERKKIEDD